MSIKNQLRVDYKLTPPPYTHEVHLEQENYTTFENLQTPGWTSMVRTEPNAELSNRTTSNHEKILDKLNKMQHVDLSNSQFSKIKFKDSANNNLASSNYDCSTLSRSRNNKQNVSVHLRSFNQEQKHKRLEVTTLPSQSRIEMQNSRQTNKSLPKRGKTAIIVKNIPKQLEKSVGQTERQNRFNCITVHEHLYLDSKRQETKRMMQQIFEEQYKKKNTFIFKPSISQKSRELAENKHSRMQKMQEMESELIHQLQQLNNRQNQKAKLNPKVSTNKQSKQKIQYEALHILFQLLSNNNENITKQTLKQTITQLPLVCIRFLEKIIEKIYQGKQFTWLEFLSAINDKKIVSNRQSLLVIVEKWVNRNKKTKTKQLQPNLAHSTYCQ